MACSCRKQAVQKKDWFCCLRMSALIFHANRYQAYSKHEERSRTSAFHLSNSLLCETSITWTKSLITASTRHSVAPMSTIIIVLVGRMLPSYSCTNQKRKKRVSNVKTNRVGVESSVTCPLISNCKHESVVLTVPMTPESPSKSRAGSSH